VAVHDQNPAHGDALDVTRGRALGTYAALGVQVRLI